MSFDYNFDVLFLLIHKLLGTPSQIFIEFFVLVFPVILSVTIANEYMMEINVALLVITISIIAFQLKNKWHLEPFIQIPVKKPQFMTIARSVVNLISVICILAVDFKCFPRSLAKTETYGFGLMDTGVGLFVLINGCVSQEARVKEYERMTWKRFSKTLLGIVPLISLGMIRFFVTNEIDYQQHISEYGVHWNFFMTLAAVRLFGSLCIGVLPSPKYAHFLCIAIMCCHEMALQLGLSNYVMTAKRDTFINANREGIVSIPGYIALYLIALWAGNLLQQEKEYIRPKEMLRPFAKFSLISVFCWKMVYVCDRMFGTSRRLANMSYCFWMVSIAGTMLVLFMALEVVMHFMLFDKTTKDTKDNKKQSNRQEFAPLLHRAINQNALIFFLLGNLLTGLVNMIFQTMLLSTLASMVIISYYGFTITIVMTFLYVNKIKLKFW